MINDYCIFFDSELFCNIYKVFMAKLRCHNFCSDSLIELMNILFLSYILFIVYTNLPKKYRENLNIQVRVRMKMK